MTIQEIYQKALDVYLEHRKNNPDFTFYLRKKTGVRLERGYWFQGNENYVCTSPYQFKDNNNKTQQINFVIDKNRKNACVQVSLLHDENKEYEEFFIAVLEHFDIKNTGWGRRYEKELCKLNEGNLWLEKLEKFLQNDVPEINKVAKKYEVPSEKLFFSEDEFNKRYNRIKEIQNSETPIEATSEPQKMTDNKNPLNQIFYGPPGTGKTYSTVDEALKILEATDEQKSKIKSIGELKKSFGSQVEFVTFHQSFSYEDFVEGLKASSGDDGKISYDIEPGVFKKICKSAEESENKSLAKFEEAIEKLKQQVTEEPINLKTPSKQKKFTLSYYGNKAFYAKPHEGKHNNPVSIKAITELFKNPNLKDGQEQVFFKAYTAPVIQYLKDNFGVRDYQQDQNQKPHVLIIDEINRGNISRIFGELITLIEPSKRQGAKETIAVTLPYSKKETFSVPDNLYIIGTMNTADRSLATLDIALRRRFRFVEMMPNYTLDKIQKEIEGISIDKLLEAMNSRIIQLLDREHQIGHSFFMNINSLAELKETFKYEILPLMEEYFFDDWQKIKQVLNDKKTGVFYQEEVINDEWKVENADENALIKRCDDWKNIKAVDFINIYQAQTQDSNNQVESSNDVDLSSSS